MEIIEPPARVLEEISHALGWPAFSVSDLLRTFFEGSGIPFPELFEEIKTTFDTVINLSEIDSSGFRSKVFTWASTGSHCIGSQDETIKVSQMVSV